MCTLYLLSNGLKARQDHGRIVVEKDGEVVQSMPMQLLRSVVAGEHAGLTTPLLLELLNREISVCFVDFYGNVKARLESDRVGWQYSKCQLERFFAAKAAAASFGCRERQRKR